MAEKKLVIPITEATRRKLKIFCAERGLLMKDEADLAICHWVTTQAVAKWPAQSLQESVDGIRELLKDVDPAVSDFEAEQNQ